MATLFANIGDPDQTLHYVASDLGLHCLPITLLGVSRLQWVNSVDLEIICIKYSKAYFLGKKTRKNISKSCLKFLPIVP